MNDKPLNTDTHKDDGGGGGGYNVTCVAHWLAW